MQNKRILVLLLVVLLISGTLLIVFMLNQKKTNPTNNSISLNEKIPPEGKTTPTTKEKEKIQNIKAGRGVLESVDIGAVVFNPNEQEQTITLKIPNEGTSFVNLIKQEDGSFLNEEIGLFDLPLNEEVEVQYDSAENELMMIMVLK